MTLVFLLACAVDVSDPTVDETGYLDVDTVYITSQSELSERRTTVSVVGLPGSTDPGEPILIEPQADVVRGEAGDFVALADVALGDTVTLTHGEDVLSIPVEPLVGAAPGPEQSIMRLSLFNYADGEAFLNLEHIVPTPPFILFNETAGTSARFDAVDTAPSITAEIGHTVCLFELVGEGSSPSACMELYAEE